MIFDMFDDYMNLSFVLIITVIFFFYYYFNIVRPPVLTCASIKFKLFLKQSMPILSEKYWPTIWCCGGRCITSVQCVCPVKCFVPYQREILQLKDGGQVALDWLHNEKEDASAPIILILPGIMGHSGDNYVKKFVVNAHESNFRCAVFNYRGRGGVELKTPKLYCLNDTSDLVQVVQHIRSCYPNAVLGACGISMGASILAHYLIEYSQQRDIRVAMMNNAIFDVLGAIAKMESGFMNICINKFLAYKLRQFLVARFKHVLNISDAPWDVEEIMKTRTVREFDDSFTSKMFGYKNANEYYKEATLLDKMDKIKIPVLCLNAADDPSQPLEYSENNDAPFFCSDYVTVVLTAAGGHTSHLEGLWPFYKKYTYMHRVYIQYFRAMFHNDSYKLFLPTMPS